MVTRAAFERIGGFENQFRGMYEDQALFYKLFLHCRTYKIDAILDWYRQHPDSCCALAARAGEYRLDGGASLARRGLLDWCACYLRKYAPGEPRRRAVVAVQQWLQQHPELKRRVSHAAIAGRGVLA
jgi:hypothetical protein